MRAVAKKDAVRFVIGVLSPIINVGESDQFLQVCHKSLSDFLLDENRTQEVFKQVLKPSDGGGLDRYIIRRSEQGARLVEACLQLMNDKLIYNICRIPTSHCFNNAPPIAMRSRQILFLAFSYTPADTGQSISVRWMGARISQITFYTI